MPYITEKDRIAIEYGRKIKTVGELNYSVTQLIGDYLDQNGGRNYTNINAVVGALECAKLEVYRRVAVPYETGKIRDNGDAYKPPYVAEVVPYPSDKRTITLHNPSSQEIRVQRSQQQQSVVGVMHKDNCRDADCLGCSYPARMVGADRNDPIIMPKDPTDQGFSDVGGLEDHGDDEIKAGMPIDPHMAVVLGLSDGGGEHF